MIAAYWQAMTNPLGLDLGWTVFAGIALALFVWVEWD